MVLLINPLAVGAEALFQRCSSVDCMVFFALLCCL